MKIRQISMPIVGPLLACSFLLGGCGEQSSGAKGASVPQVTVPLSPPKKPYFVIEDEGAYGYEQAISKEEQSQGRAAAKVVMFHYLGQRGEVHQVMVKDGQTRMIAECAAPCEYAKVYSFWGNRFTDKQILKVTPEAMLQFVFEDVSNGFLKQYTGQQQGKLVQFWVDGDAKKLIVTPVAENQSKL